MTRQIGYCLLPFEPGAWHAGADNYESIETGIIEAKKAGFQAVESAARLSCSLDLARRYLADEGFPAAPLIRTDMDALHRIERLITLAEKHDMAMTSIFSSAEFINPKLQEAEVDAAMVLARVFASSGIKYFCSSMGGRRPGKGAQDVRALADVTSRMGEKMLSMGVQLCVHPHVGMIVESAEEIDAFFAAASSETVGMLVDTAHIRAAGGDPAAIVRKYKSRVKYVHLKDLWVEPGENVLVDGRYRKAFRDVGEGNFPFKPFVEALDEIGFDGPIMAELDISPDPVASLWRSRRYIAEELNLLG